MKFSSQKISYWFFGAALLLFCVQLLYGFLMGLAHMGFEPLHDILAFNVARAVHTNILQLWLFLGFMGSAYFIIPDESGTEVYSEKLAFISLFLYLGASVAAVIGFHFNWWEGRKFLEIPVLLDVLLLISSGLFIYNIAMTMQRGPKRSAIARVFLGGMVLSVLFTIPGMIYFDNILLESFFRWWSVHFRFEVAWMLSLTAVLAYLLTRMTGGDPELVEKWLYLMGGLILLTGIPAIGHHYYYTGAPAYWLWVGGIASALQPLAFLGLAVFAIGMKLRSEKREANQVALYWTIGSALTTFVGMGFLGVAQTFPMVNLWTHGTLIEVTSSHLSFWGAFAMMIFAMMTYALPLMSGRRLWNNIAGFTAFWTSTLGIICMSGAIAVAGVAQVYMERKLGIDFMVVQREIQLHFLGFLPAALFFALGIGLFIYNFVRFGRPSDEALQTPENTEYLDYF